MRGERVPVKAAGQLAGKQLCREELGGPVGHQIECEPEMCPCSKEGQLYLGCIRKRVASRLREVTFPLYSALVRHIWSAVSSLVFLMRDRNIFEQVQQGIAKMIK